MTRGIKRKTKYKVYPMLIACRCDAGLTQEELPFTIYEMFEIQKMLNERLGKYYTLDELFEMERL